MLLEEFANMTRRIIQKDDFEDFLPTLCLPERKHIAVLEEAPTEDLSELRSIALAWARNAAKGEEEFLLAFREDSASFRVIRSAGGTIEESVFPVDAGSLD